MYLYISPRTVWWGLRLFFSSHSWPSFSSSICFHCHPRYTFRYHVVPPSIPSLLSLSHHSLLSLQFLSLGLRFQSLSLLSLPLFNHMLSPLVVSAYESSPISSPFHTSYLLQFRHPLFPLLQHRLLIFTSESGIGLMENPPHLYHDHLRSQGSSTTHKAQFTPHQHWVFTTVASYTPIFRDFLTAVHSVQSLNLWNLIMKQFKIMNGIRSWRKSSRLFLESHLECYSTSPKCDPLVVDGFTRSSIDLMVLWSIERRVW